MLEKIVYDGDIEGTFNVSPDTVVSMKDIAELTGKILISMPLSLFRFIYWVLYKLRITKYPPVMAKLVAYPIIASPRKLQERYGYHFRYSSKEAFHKAVEEKGFFQSWREKFAVS